MKTLIEIVPVEWTAAQSVWLPRDPALAECVKAFCEREFGRQLDLTPVRVMKAWAAMEPHKDGGWERCWGIIAIKQVVYANTCHISVPADSHEEALKALQSRDGLVARARAYIQDNGGLGLETFVYIAPEARAKWNGFVEKIGGRDANVVVLEA